MHTDRGTWTARVHIANVGNNIQSCNKLMKWHIRLGHPSIEILSKVLHDCNVHIKNKTPLFCEAR